MKHILTILFAGFLLTSCAHEAGTRDMDPTDYRSAFGQSVRQNIAAQIANPEAPASDAVTADGSRVTAAQQRYKADKVESPARTNTLRSGTGGGGSEE